MANQDSNRTIQTAEFNSATLKLEGAKALISTIGIFIDEAGEEMPVTGQLLARATNGVRLLIESAETDLMTSP